MNIEYKNNGNQRQYPQLVTKILSHVLVSSKNIPGIYLVLYII